MGFSFLFESMVVNGLTKYARLLQDAEYIEEKLSTIDGGAEIGAHFVSIVGTKHIGTQSEVTESDTA